MDTIAMYCNPFFLLLLVTTVAVAATAAAVPPQNPCYPDDNGGRHSAGLMCNKRYSKLYSIFKMLEDQLIKNELALFSLHQAIYDMSFSRTPANTVNYIHACVHVNIASETSALNFTGRESSRLQNGTHCYWLQWTSSWLFSHITVDQFLIFDNMFSKIVYDAYIGHSSPRTTDLHFHLTLNDSTGVFSDEELEMAVMLLGSKAKSYAKYQGRPPHHDIETIGYVSSSYSRYVAVNLIDYNPANPYKRLSTSSDTIYVRWLSLVLFIGLNTFLVFTRPSVVLAVCKSQTFLQTKHHFILKCIIIEIVAFNAIYSLTSFFSVMPIGTDTVPEVVGCLMQECSLPRGLRQDEMYSLFAKVVIITIATVHDLFATVLITRSIIISHSTTSRQNHLTCNHLKRSLLIAVVVWNVLAFIQITVGMMSIPMAIILVIDPLNATLHIGILVLIAMSPILVVITTFQHSSLHTHSSSKMSAASCYSKFQQVMTGLFIVWVLVHAMIMYYLYPAYDQRLSHFSTETVIVLLPYLSLYPAIQWGRRWWRERKQRRGMEEVGVVYTPSTSGERETYSDCSDVELLSVDITP